VTFKEELAAVTGERARVTTGEVGLGVREEVGKRLGLSYTGGYENLVCKTKHFVINSFVSLILSQWRDLRTGKTSRIWGL